MSKVIGCLFGSFNPIHMGHLIIGQYMATQTDCDVVHFIVSPQNPLKRPEGLADENHRLAMARLGVRRNPLLHVNSVEFGLTRPSYTFNTLTHLRSRNPDNTYRLIIGSDNLAIFKKWRNWERILDEFGCYVYLRPGHSPGHMARHRKVQVFDAPLLDISASYIRRRLQKDESIRYLVAENVRRYIVTHDVYAFLD